MEIKENFDIKNLTTFKVSGKIKKVFFPESVEEFCKILEYLGNKLGNIALNNFHGHVAGIEYSQKGEKKHLIFEEADFNYKDLLKAFKTFDVKGVLVSPCSVKTAVNIGSVDSVFVKLFSVFFNPFIL